MSLDPKSICDTIFTCWDRTAKYRKYIRSLGENLNALETKVAELGYIYTEVNRLVETAEAEGWIRNSVADGWLKKVETLKQGANLILADGKKIVEGKCLCGLCCWNCRPRYKQSCLADAKKVDVEAELVQGRAFRVKLDVAYEPADLILKRSVGALRDKMGELNNVFDTVKQRVKREEEQHSVRTPEVGGWLKRVEGLLGKEAPAVLKEGELELVKSCQSRVQGDSQYQRNSPLYHGISKRVDEKRAILEQKLVEGHGFAVFTGKPDDPPILEIPCDPPVGVESVFKEVWDWVEDETVRCIGLFGMGGVGKTTLLDRVHNQFLKVSHDYNFALRIVVSRPVNLDGIQEAILKEIKLPKDQWDDLDRIKRASLIYRLMKEKNFLLFLDDLWDSIDLVKDIGIPYLRDHPKKCKIMFTTREEGVCNRMRPDKRKKVECLPQNEALQLFRQKLGEETWGAHPWIPEIAASLVHECKCLPIALITVAGAMAGTIELKDWMDAEKYLKSRLSEFPDMNERVLANLEFSCKNLPDDTHRTCFLYLSIFPEDHIICEDEAINLWIGEGFLDKRCDALEVRNYGEQIFRRLKRACLVEFVRDSSLHGEMVKMHDVVREMALWVDSKYGLEKDRVLVREKLVSFSSEERKKWDEAKRIILWRSSCDSLATVSCSRLSTMIIRGTKLETIPDDFFSLMPCLRVLDLSDNDYLTDLPKSIWKLINLRYLNLNLVLISKGKPWEVAINVLPTEIKNLNKLVVLILSRSFLLPKNVLSNLLSLKVFCRPYGGIFDGGSGEYDRELLGELQRMQSVGEIFIALHSQEGVKMLLSCANLQSNLRKLFLHLWNDLDSFKISTSSLRRLQHLSSLTLVDCYKIRQIEITGGDKGSDGSSGRNSYVESSPKPPSFSRLDIFRSLGVVTFFRCTELVDVTSLIHHAPVLKTLKIGFCSSLKEVIAGDIENNEVTMKRLFPSLAYLRLQDLNNLEKICRRALPFPSLKDMKINCCPELRELPLNSDSAKALQVIAGEKEWWDGLEWEDPASKQIFAAKFVSWSSDGIYL